MVYHRKWKTNAINNSAPAHGTINITWNPDIEAYETSFPYHELFINWIKTNIPTNKRSMDYDSSRTPKYKWMFEQQTMETVILPMMKAMFTSCRFVIVNKAKVDEYNKGFQQTIPIDKDKLKKEFRQLVIDAGVSTELDDRKQYLRAAMYYHPDRNPAMAAQMSRLNEIWTTVFVEKEQVSGEQQ